MNARTLTMIRNASFSLLGLILLAYWVGVLVTGRPDPFPWWVTAVAGVATAVVNMLAALLAGRHAVAITWGELVREEWKDCLRLGYWVSVWLYPLFAVLIGLSLVDFSQSFAAMGTLTASSPFLLFLSKWLRGRV